MFRLSMVAIKDVYRKRFKTILYSVVIATCISALIIVVALNKAISEAIDNNIINSINNRQILVAVNNNNDGKSLDEDISYLKSFEHVEDVFKYVNPMIAQISKDSDLSKGSYLLASGSEKYFPKVIDGKNVSKDKKNVAIIPQKLYIQDGSGKSIKTIQGSSLIGKTINLTYGNGNTSSAFNYSCEVIGTYQNKVSDNEVKIYIPLKDMYEINKNSGQETNSGFLFTVIIDKKDNVDYMIKQISQKDNFQAKRLQSENISETRSYKIITKVSGYMIYSIFVFLTIMLYICVTNIAINNKKQVAIYKALGYNNRHIFKIVFLEAIIILLLGYLEAVLISFLSNSFLINPIIYSKTSLEIAVSINLSSCIIPLAIIVPIALIVSLVSYFRVKNIYPAILLKQD